LVLEPTYETKVSQRGEAGFRNMQRRNAAWDNALPCRVRDKPVFARQSRIVIANEDSMRRIFAHHSLGTDGQRSHKRILVHKMVCVHSVHHRWLYPAQRTEKHRPATVRVNNVRSQLAHYLADSDWNPRIEPTAEELDPKSRNSQMTRLAQQVRVFLGYESERILALEAGEYLQCMARAPARTTVSDDL
jgi:hypothetical protein